MKSQDQEMLKFLTRVREDFQALRKAIDNRLGRKADGSAQDVRRRFLRVDDVLILASISDEARQMEAIIAGKLASVLKRFPVYNEWLSTVKGVGPIAAGWLLAEFDIKKAVTVSKMWQYAGLNPGEVRGKKRVKIEDYTKDMGQIVRTLMNKEDQPEAYIVQTDDMVRADKATPEFVLPYNKRLRTALVGVLASGFLKAQSPYALNFYYPYKERLEHERNAVKGDGKAWKDVSKGHRDMAAKRYMIKMFLKDLYLEWRVRENLPVRPSYQQEYLGHEKEPVTV